MLFSTALGMSPELTTGPATYAWAFGQGVLVDLTPCVYPLIPITVAVFGAKGVSRGRALFLASAYVLGMAVLYTSLGIAVGMSGAAFGTWLGDPVVVLPIVVLLLALAASMFGAFDLQLPAAFQSRLGTVGGAGPAGAFLMGLVSGFISAPCSGPVLLSLLAFIATSSAQGGSLFHAGSLLFVYALGMGTLFFAVALGASLFKPGAWMEYIKSFFGISLIVMALWFLRPIWPELDAWAIHPRWGIAFGIAIAIAGILAGAIHLTFYGPVSERVRKGLAVATTVCGAQIAINNILYVPPMSWTRVTTLAELETAAVGAEADGKPVLVDFGATWCGPCKELELGTFHDAAVEPLLARRFALVRVDVTQPNEDERRIHDALVGGALPGVVIFDRNAQLSEHVRSFTVGDGTLPEPAARFTALVGPETFLHAMEGVL